MADPDDSQIDAIAEALSRLRGLRRFGPGAGEGRGPDGQAHRGPHDGPRHHHAGFGGPFGAHGGRGPFGSGGAPGEGRGRMAGLARLRMLEALAAAPDPLSVSAIGEAIGVDQPRASRLVQQAVELDLVRREADPDDARRTRIALTDAGRRLAQGVRGERRAALGGALADFSDVERAELARLLGKLADAWPRR
ncbi:MarR family winged helix-turn-helix transcriptional regulator [Microbacterium oleivorans]|uniref:MarR family winged helix-turn-helix transcriptional regulator n=1 Tax=Microbacterium oleivorans TaxID=273677 RepID=UPI002115FA9E|nr:MarR family winged helix-turn-helix transcriptional regulator [Microbacterium oleivorans]